MTVANVTPFEGRSAEQRSETLVVRFTNNVLPYVVSFAALFLAWHFASTLLVKSILFPTPYRVLVKALEMIANGTLIENVFASLKRIGIGFVLGSALAVPIGLTMGSFTVARKLIEPWTEFLRFIPSVALITIAVIWFGIGEEGKIFLIMYTTVFIVIINTAAGVAAIPRNMIRAARSLGATRWQVYFFVALPATVPFILTGMRLAMANSFTTVVAAEMISAPSGLGVMLWNGRLFMLVEEIFVSLVTLGLLGFTADRLFRLAIRQFASRYQPIV